MKTAHTPGPWILEAGRSINTSSGNFYLSYGKDKHRNPNFSNFCELDRNAQLIAAAPDLLAALEAMVATWEGPRELAALRFAKNVIDARIAIDKAKGE